MWYNRDWTKDTDANMSSHQIIDRLASTPIGHMLKLDHGELGEPFPDEMLLSTRTRSGIAQT